MSTELKLKSGIRIRYHVQKETKFANYARINGYRIKMKKWHFYWNKGKELKSYVQEEMKFENYIRIKD